MSSDIEKDVPQYSAEIMKFRILAFLIINCAILAKAGENLSARNFEVKINGVSLAPKEESKKLIKKKLLMEFPVFPQGLDVNHQGEFILSSWASKEAPWEGNPTLPIRNWKSETEFTQLASLIYDDSIDDDNLLKKKLTFYVGDVAQDANGVLFFARANYFPGKIYRIDPEDTEKVVHIKTGKTVRAIETPVFDSAHIYALNPDGITRYKKNSQISDKGEGFLEIEGRHIQLSSFTFLNGDTLLLSLSLGDPENDPNWNNTEPLLLLLDRSAKTYQVIARQQVGDLDSTPTINQHRFYSLWGNKLYEFEFN